MISGLWVLTQTPVTSVNYKCNGKGLGIYSFWAFGLDGLTYYISQNIKSLASYDLETLIPIRDLNLHIFKSSRLWIMLRLLMYQTCLL